MHTATVKHDLHPADLGRVENRLEIEVDVEPMATTIASQRIAQGKHRVIIFESELDQVQAQVQKPEHLETMKVCREMHEQDIVTYAKDHCGGNVEKARAKIGTSAEEHFCRRYRKGMPPLRSLKVIGEVGPPDSPQARADRDRGALASAMERQTEVLSKLLGQRNQGGQKQG